MLAMQLDLFAPPPAPASVILPNEHGVYPEDQAELLILQHPRAGRGWQGCPTAQIVLLHTPDGWLSSSGAQIPDRGYAGPTCPPFYSSRDQALIPQIERLQRFAAQAAACRSSTCGEASKREARRILAWLEGLA